MERTPQADRGPRQNVADLTGPTKFIVIDNDQLHEIGTDLTFVIIISTWTAVILMKRALNRG